EVVFGGYPVLPNGLDIGKCRVSSRVLCVETNSLARCHFCFLQRGLDKWPAYVNWSAVSRPGVDRQKGIALREQCPRGRIGWIAHERRFEQRHRIADVSGAEQHSGAQELLIGFDIAGAARDELLALLQTQRHLQ